MLAAKSRDLENTLEEKKKHEKHTKELEIVLTDAENALREAQEKITAKETEVSRAQEGLQTQMQLVKVMVRKRRDWF